MTRVIRVQSKNKTVKKSVKLLFIFLQVIFSLDFGYVHYSSRNKNFLIKFLTFMQCSAIFGVSFLYFVENTRDSFTLAWIISISIQYFFNSIVMLFYGRTNSYCMLQETLMSVDVKLAIDTESYGLDNKLISGCVMCILLKVFLMTLFCYEDHSECVFTFYGAFFNMLQLLSFDIILTTSFFIFYSVYRRLKIFNDFVMNTSQVLQSLDMYKAMVDGIEKPKKYFDCLYTLALLIKTPDLILTTYLGLLKAKDYGGVELTHHQVVRYMYMLHNFGLLCSPAICAGVVTSTVARLKLILQDRMLLEQGQNHECLLQMFVDYVTYARPMKFTMFKIIPLDWKLPIMILNLCISYQIVIVQFTKLY